VQIRLSLSSVLVYLEGREIARHLRSYVPADVVIDPTTPGPCLSPERPASACAVEMWPWRFLISPAMTLCLG